MKFRSDIQILRGVSVLFVVLFHLGFEFFRNGLLGVDVFFVISGFLMAVLYEPNNKVKFFRRRALRLLPSYYVVIIATVIFSFLITTRNESVQVFDQAIWASVFTSNIGFWLENSYFDQGTFKPLLHLWSLGVEIQFYLLVPLISFFVRKNKLLLLFFLITSLVLCFGAISISPKTAFFITPFRIWQFLIGYGVALYFTNQGDTNTKGYGWVGSFALLIILFVLFLPLDGASTSALTGHPGVFSLIISSATALALALGLPSFVENSSLGKTLEVLGKYSYSIYLAHFPVIVIYNSRPFEGTVYGADTIFDLVAITLLIALFSYMLFNFVERKTLPKVVLNRWKATALASGIGILVLSSFLNFIQEKGLTPKERMIFSAKSDRTWSRCGKSFRLLNPTEAICEITGKSESQSNGDIMLLGNSHATSIRGSFIKAALKHDYNLWFFVLNSAMNVDGPSPRKIINKAVQASVSIIYVHQSAMSFDKKTLESLLLAARDEGIGVVYIEPVPVWETSIPKAMYYDDSSLQQKREVLSKSVEEYYEENKKIFLALNELSNSFTFSRVSTSEVLCTPGCLYKSAEGSPLYFDAHHLTETGSALLYPLIERKVAYFGTDIDNISELNADTLPKVEL